MCIKLINKTLSSIPPYALYFSCKRIVSNVESRMLYRDHFYARESDVVKRAKHAWLFDIRISLEDLPFVPLAVQIERYYSDSTAIIDLSPLTYAYYMMFLCYQGLGQYDNRDRALRQLVDTANDGKRSGTWRHLSYNIAGHCLLITGRVDMARTLFLKSAQFTNIYQVLDKYNSAYHYLSYI